MHIISRLAVVFFLFCLFLFGAVCGGCSDDDDSGGNPSDDDTADDDTADDDAVDDDAVDDDAADDDTTPDDDTGNDVLFSDNFESYTTYDPLGTPWTVEIVGPGEASIYPADDTSYGNCLIIDGGVDTGQYVIASLPITPIEENFTVTFEFWTGGNTGYFSLSTDGGVHWDASVGNTSDGDLWGHDGTDWAEPCGTITLFEWNTIVMTLHYDDGTYDVELNDSTVCTGLAPDGVSAEPSYNTVLAHDDSIAGNGGPIYFDNILGEAL